MNNYSNKKQTKIKAKNSFICKTNIQHKNSKIIKK